MVFMTTMVKVKGSLDQVLQMSFLNKSNLRLFSNYIELKIEK